MTSSLSFSQLTNSSTTMMTSSAVSSIAGKAAGKAVRADLVGFLHFLGKMTISSKMASEAVPSHHRPASAAQEAAGRQSQ
jgi:molybdopterin synthase catalytic subunit